MVQKYGRTISPSAFMGLFLLRKTNLALFRTLVKKKGKFWASFKSKVTQLVKCNKNTAL